MGCRISLPVCTPVIQSTLIKNPSWASHGTKCTFWKCCGLFGLVLSLRCTFARGKKLLGKLKSCLKVMCRMERAYQDWSTPLLFPCEIRVKLADLRLLNNKQLLRRSSPTSMPGLHGVLGSGAVLVCGLRARENSGCKWKQRSESSRRLVLLCWERIGNEDLSSVSK